MKKFLSILVALSVISSAVSANVADPKTPMGMAVIKSGSVVKLFYRSEQTGDVKVKITDANGNSVFTETIRHIDNFVRPYNFASLSEGEYTIELNGQDGKQTQQVSYHADATHKLANILHVTGSDNRYLLTVANKSGADVLKIKIYNGNNLLLYSESQAIIGDFAKIYNLDKIGKDFVIEVTDGSGSTQLLSYSK